VLGLEDRGRIAVGRRADLLVLGANPLDDIRNSRRIDAVWQAGQQVAGPIEAAADTAARD
ncbi:MAG: amidohydrolase family protein, partial [Stenotrophomonas maltophilia]